MEIDYLDETTCDYCRGNGCKGCGFTGKTEKSGEGSKMYIDAPEYETDRLVNQLNKLQLREPIARKEYSMAYTFYKELKSLASDVESDVFIKAWQELLEQLIAYNLDGIKPVGNMMDIMKSMRELILNLKQRSKLMAIHFEASLEIMNRQNKSLDEDFYKIQNIYEKQKKQLLVLQQKLDVLEKEQEKNEKKNKKKSKKIKSKPDPLFEEDLLGEEDDEEEDKEEENEDED